MMSIHGSSGFIKFSRRQSMALAKVKGNTKQITENYDLTIYKISKHFLHKCKKDRHKIVFSCFC